MTIRVGDTVFDRTGIPKNVEGIDEKSGQLRLKNSKNDKSSNARHGIINGLSDKQRIDFNKILDEIKNEKDTYIRIEKLQTKITELEENNADRHLVKYLRSELSYMMNTSGYTPKSYTTNNP